MAARTRKIRHDDETRAKIKTSQLINRLNDHIFNGLDLSTTQMKAIELLLRKTLPDLAAITLTGDAENPLHHKIGTDDSFSAVVGALESAARAKSGSTGGASNVDQQGKTCADNT